MNQDPALSAVMVEVRRHEASAKRRIGSRRPEDSILYRRCREIVGRQELFDRSQSAADQLLRLKASISTLMQAGRNLGEVEEEIIGPAELGEDAKAALWLYAWAFLPERVQRTEAEAHLRRLAEKLN